MKKSLLLLLLLPLPIGGCGLMLAREIASTPRKELRATVHEAVFSGGWEVRRFHEEPIRGFKYRSQAQRVADRMNGK